MMPGFMQVVAPSGAASTQTVAIPPVDPVFQSDLNNGFRKVCFYFLLGLIFIRFSMLHQLLAYKFRVDTYVLYIFGAPCIIGFLMTGGLRRLFRFKPPLYWCIFAVLIILSSAFSTWRGGSVGLVSTYLRTDFNMLFLMGGLAVGWKECRAMILTLSLSTLMSELSIRMFGQVDSNGRTNLEFGSIQNSNDYAAHLILVLPFLLWAALSSKSFVYRIVALLGVAYGCYLVVASASRGGFIALVVSVLVTLYMGTGRQRIVGIALASLMLMVAIALVPPQAFQRILSLSENSTDASQEALMSSRIRQQLLRDSFMFAITHPLLGVGPGQFNQNEGQSRKDSHQIGFYYEAHNSYMQVASECGIPALLCYVGGIISTLLLLKKVQRKIQGDETLTDARNALVCTRVAIIGLCTAITFVNFAFFFYLPAIAGLAAAFGGAFPEQPAPPQQQPWPSPRKQSLAAPQFRPRTQNRA